jgi:hypothetical protein
MQKSDINIPENNLDWDSINSELKTIPRYNLNYRDREKLKSVGWKLYNPKNDTYTRMDGIRFICDAHYWRAVEALDCPKKRSKLKKIRGKKYYPGYELDIDHYTPNWLASVRHLFDPEAVELFKKTYYYQEEPNKYLPKGCTIYQV